MNVEDSVLLLLDHQSSLFYTTKASLRRRFAARLPGFVALMKPRVMSLAVFRAFVGLTIARLCDLLLCRRVHDVAEAEDATKHCHRRRRGRSPHD
jgi:hypothetical protein